MTHADFTFYHDVYQGELKEEAFDRLALRAQAVIRRLTRSRACEAPLPSCLAECAVADELARGERRAVTRESVGKYTVSYASSDTDTGGRLYEAAALYLEPTGLLYAGF